jgi:NitT/TauT family transport system substrate-binding protein
MSRWIAVALAALALVLSPAVAPAQTKVKVHLDWLVNGYHAPFFVALDKGWYKEGGLDVTVVPGKGSFDAIRTAATGNAEFGFADGAVMAKSVTEGLPVKMVAIMVQETLAGIVSFADKKVEKPKDLEGKSVGIVPETASARILPAFFKTAGVDGSRVKTVNFTFATQIPSLLANQVDTIEGYIIGEYLAARRGAPDRKVNWMPFSDYGLRMYSSGILVNNDFLAKNPQAVRAFVKASIRGLDWTLKNIDGAVDIVAKHTETDKPQLKEQLEVAVPYIDTPEARKLGLGAMSAEKWDRTQQIMVEFGGQAKKAPNDQIFTNEFLK